MVALILGTLVVGNCPLHLRAFAAAFNSASPQGRFILLVGGLMPTKDIECRQLNTIKISANFRK